MLISKSCDVFVAGVGIAGVFALRGISKDIEVVGVDKREKLGYPVKCGEIIPTKREMVELLPDLCDYSMFDIPKRFESNRTKFVSFCLPNGKTFDFEFEFHVVRRDEMIQKLAEESEHKIKLKTLVKDFKNDKVFTSDGVYEPKVLLACDGANSRIAKSLNLWRYELSMAKQYVMGNVECDEDTVYMFVGKSISPGAYGWIIPKGDGIANVGVGFRKGFGGESVHKALENFVKKYPYSSKFLKKAETINKIGAVVPIDIPIEKAVHGNVLIIGDAASMIISHVGGGIPTSMVAGDLGAKTVNEFFNGGKLEEFDFLWKKYLYEPLRRSYLLRRLWDKFADDEKFCRIMRFASSKDLAKIFRCKIPFKVKLLAKLVGL